MKVLVVGCGLGEDLPLIHGAIGADGQLHAQDISRTMVEAAAAGFRDPGAMFSVSSAMELPYRSRYFDVVFHFGGINAFGDVGKAIGEMERVCRVGGRVVFGDEGVASHLRATEYGKIAIANIPLWASEPPLHLLPTNAGSIRLEYVLGNCFYVLSFSPAAGLPHMNIDVPHKGLRGGTARTRYFGLLEGVSEATKAKVLEKARRDGISVHEMLDRLINKGLS